MSDKLTPIDAMLRKRYSTEYEIARFLSDKTAELSLCGLVLTSDQNALALLEVIPLDHFHFEPARIVWTAAQELNAAAATIDAEAVAEHLAKSGRLEDVGHIPGLSEMMENADPYWLERNAETIADRAHRRTVSKLLASIVRKLGDPAEDVSEIADEIATVAEMRPVETVRLIGGHAR